MNGPNLSPETAKMLAETMAAIDPLAGKLMAMSIEQAEEPRRRLLSGLAIILAGGTLPQFERMAAGAFAVAMMAAGAPLDCECPRCRAKGGPEQCFGA